MMSITEDNLNSEIIEGKALETIINALVRTLKRRNKKCGREEVSKLKQNFQESLWKTVDDLTENQFVNCDIASNREWLSVLKHSKLHHRSIEYNQDASSNMNFQLLTLC